MDKYNAQAVPGWSSNVKLIKLTIKLTTTVSLDSGNSKLTVPDSILIQQSVTIQVVNFEGLNFCGMGS